MMFRHGHFARSVSLNVSYSDSNKPSPSDSHITGTEENLVRYGPWIWQGPGFGKFGHRNLFDVLNLFIFIVIFYYL